MLDMNKMPDEAQPKRVVVVEDDPSIAMLISSILEDAGYVPFVVQDGRQALQVVRKLRPFVITLDLELSGLDGRAVLHRLVDDALLSHVPVVVVSGSIELLSREEHGLISQAVSKPFDCDALVAAVDAAVARESS
jgi:CheY-like chemotaxis protein